MPWRSLLRTIARLMTVSTPMASIRRRGRAKRNAWMVDYRDGAGVRRRITAATREVAEDLLSDEIREGRQASPAAADREIALAAYAETMARAGLGRPEGLHAHLVQGDARPTQWAAVGRVHVG